MRAAVNHEVTFYGEGAWVVKEKKCRLCSASLTALRVVAFVFSFKSSMCISCFFFFRVGYDFQISSISLHCVTHVLQCMIHVVHSCPYTSDAFV